MAILDLDRVDTWEPLLSAWMSEFASAELLAAAAVASPEFLEDARDIFISSLGRDELIEHLSARFSEHDVRVFHGTRVTDEDSERIKLEGLRPLTLIDRRQCLTEIFSKHPMWSQVSSKLDEQLHRFGSGWERGGAGRREDGCVHACLSRAGLLRGCNHYLMYGAEVDGHIAHALFGNDTGEKLLHAGRKPKLVSFVAHYKVAAHAANPYGFGSVTMPIVMESIFSAWAFRLSHPLYQPAQERSCTALRFSGPIAANRLTIEEIADEELGDHR